MDESTSATDGSSSIINTSVANELQDTTERLQNLTEDDVQAMSNMGLVELRDAIKELEDTVESVRKDTVDPELEGRIAPGDSMLGISHIESHSKYVAENEISVIMRAVAKEIDYTQFVDVNASTLASDFPELAEIKRREYTYLR